MSKKTPTSSKIVANLSPIGKDVGLHAHLRCAGEKGKLVVRRGRKALGPPRARLVGGGQATEQHKSGVVSQSSVLREGRCCEGGLTLWAINRESPWRKSSEIDRRMFSSRAAESEEVLPLRDALAYTDRCLFGARERKVRLLGQSPSPEKAHYCGRI